MNVLSLFDGMSCGRIALDRVGINVDRYYSSEIDKFAAKEAAANWPDNIQLGDVTKWREWDIDWGSIDLVMGGSPCQGFSASGKKGGTKAQLNGAVVIVTDKQQYLDLKAQGAEFLSCSHLFWEYALILEHIQSLNPNVKFLLENVKMKQLYLDMISETLGVEPVLINSALVSAQTRWRWYWCNWHVEQPEDKGILLKDIIEQAPAQDTVISERQRVRLDLTNERGTFGVCFQHPSFRITKALPLMSRDYKGIAGRQHCNVVSCGAIRGRKDDSGKYIQCLEPRKDQKTNSLTTVQKDNVILRPSSIVGRRINPETGKRNDYDRNVPIIQCLQVKSSPEKMGCLTTVAKDTLLSELPPGRYPDIYKLKIGGDERCQGVTETQDGYQPHRGDVKKSGISECGRILKPEAAKTGTLTTSHAPKMVTDGDERPELISYRKLTIIECCRLQTVDDDYFKVSSKSQTYKMLGNGWTVDVIAHILSFLKKK